MENHIKNALSFGTSGRCAPFVTETQAFFSQNAWMASDFYTALCQGIDENFFAYVPVSVRLEDIVNPNTSMALAEDYKLATFACPQGRSVRLGAKLEVGENIYLASNPYNLSPAVVSAVVRKCNAWYNTLDYYGNVVKEPFVWVKENLMGAQNQHQDNMVLPNGHQHCMMQKNAQTDHIAHNTRMILGDMAYQVTGLVDFTREFTKDADIHLMAFDLHQVQPNAEDDMENAVAGGLAFSWEILVQGAGEMTPGSVQTLTAQSVRNGEAPDRDVSYLWDSNSPDTARVDENGNVTAVGEGTCTITCSLLQNPAVAGKFALSVARREGMTVSFKGQIPPMLGQYQSLVLDAVATQGGEAVQRDVEWTFSPASKAYTAQVSGNQARITCYEPMEAPLTATAFVGEASAQAQIRLTSY